jgi:hypothetical protein
MAKEKKVFKSKFFLDLFYEVMDEYWLDKDTYVIIFQDMTDSNGDTYHLEVEYHKDEEEITYTRVYEFENVHDMFPSHVFKKQIDEYILKKVGVINENDTITEATIEVKLKLAVPLNMSVGEYESWLDCLSIDVTNDEKDIKILEINKK